MPAIGIALRGAVAFGAYRVLGTRFPGGAIVAALAGWIVADLVADRIGV
jgi:hypothetical protein